MRVAARAGARQSPATLEDALDPEMVAELMRRAKVELRKRARSLRAAIPAKAIAERSERIVARLEAEPAMLAAKTVSLFWPLPGKNEVDLRAFAASLRARGVKTAWPRIDSTDKTMSFHLVDDPASFVPGPMGLSEPALDAPLAPAIDVVVVPALLVDGSGYRLGYGGGFYDRALPTLCPPGISIAVAFDFQLMPEVPIGPNDVAVQRVVVESRAFDAMPRD
jgi:5-formyltetrahydrofolate cyclo-ligase